DDDVRAETGELRDLDYVPRSGDDMDFGIELPGNAYHPPRRRWIGNRDDKQAGALDAEGAENFLARGVAIKHRLPLRARLAHGLRVQLDDEIRCVDGPQRRREIAA